MQIIDSVTADQVELTDQILVDGDPVEVASVQDSPDDNDEVRIVGFSHDTGDLVTYSLPFDYPVDIWCV